MKIVLAGAFGNLGKYILKSLVNANHEVIAADLVITEIPEIKEKYTSIKIDVTNPKTLKGLCNNSNIVISTVGLTGISTKLSNYDIDYQGNLNLLKEAESAGIKKFIYISVLKSDSATEIPMLHAKYLLEQQLKQSKLEFIIYRPTGYFYDIAKVFKPMIEKGKVTLLGHTNIHANVIHTKDFAEFIVNHLDATNKLYNIGGKETYSYEEIAKMCFDAAKKRPIIKRAPIWLFSLLIFINKLKNNGKAPIIRFSKWTLTHEMIGETKYGNTSFKKYIKDYFN